MPPEWDEPEDLGPLLGELVDPAWYRDRYPDVATPNLDPVAHFKAHGPTDWRDPNPYFDCRWYAARYPEVAASGLDPIVHYLQSGAASLLDPHPNFDARWYVQQHPDATRDPLLYHLRLGATRGFATEKPVDVRDFLPSEAAPAAARAGGFVDVVAFGFSSVDQAKRCLAPILGHRRFPLARVIVIEHGKSDWPLSSWLNALSANGEIHLIREPRRLGFAACAKRGIDAAETHDIILLHADARTSSESLCRLAAHAWSGRRVATVCALSDDPAAGEHCIPTFGRPGPEVEAVCQSVNAGRAVESLSASGGCLYIRRKALDAVGGLPNGLDPVAHFCKRATAAGWQHRLACDAFVRFGSGNGGTSHERASLAPETERRHRPDPIDPFRFAITAALFRQSGLPVILMVSHALGGGIRRHIDSLVERYIGRAHFLLLAGADRGASLSVLQEPHHPPAILPSDRLDEMVMLLRSAGVTRVHIHHLLDQAIDVRRMIQRLSVPFDVTVHDYYAICPQVNLLRWPEGLYCGEPDRAGCNRCIAEFSSHHAKEILSWRLEQDWQFIKAERVICPSEDVRTRMSRYGAGPNALVVPHERHPGGDWPMMLPGDPVSPLKVVLLGVLANHKGARIVASVAEAAEPESLAIHLIGHLEASFPKPAIKFISATGKYREHELDALLDEARPQVFWFPSTAPETYSYTLTTAINTGLPIVATNLGAFKERLAGRPNTWLVDFDAPASVWLATFEAVRERLRADTPLPRVRRPDAVSRFYETAYLAPEAAIRPAARCGRPRIAVLPERRENEALTASAYARLLQPLDHPAIGEGFEIVLVDIETVFDCAAEIVVTQRHAVPDAETADRLNAYVRRIGGSLVYDLDDDVLGMPRQSQEKQQAARRMLTVADAVWVSTQALADRMSAIRPDAEVVEDRLDERIWVAPPPPAPYWDDPIRILYFGSGTPDDDLAMIEPALSRLVMDYGERISIDVLGMVRPLTAGRGLNGLSPSAHGARSYPGFVDWITRSQPSWHIGLAPLRDTAANRCRSPVRALEYAALGLAVLASDVPAYRGSIADGPAGQLVANTVVAWHAALDWMIRDQNLRRRLGVQAREAFVGSGFTGQRRTPARRGAARAIARRRLAARLGRVNYIA